MSTTDIIIECKDCNKPFTLTVEHQAWYRDRGLELPKRCSECRKKRREANNKKEEAYHGRDE